MRRPFSQGFLPRKLMFIGTPIIHLLFVPSRLERLRLEVSLASDEAKPSDRFAHETPNPPVRSVTQVAEHAY